MSETAGQMVKDALVEITVQDDEQDVSGTDMAIGLRYLNRMMQLLDADGLKLGYTLVDGPNDPLTVPAGAYEGMMLNLALRLAPQFDVAASNELRMNARDAKRVMYKLGIQNRKMNFPSILPIGSGNEGESELYPEQHFFDGCCEDVDECVTKESS